MNDTNSSTAAQKKFREQKLIFWIGGTFLVVLISALAGMEWLVQHAEPILKRRVEDSLTARFQSPVQLREFHISLLNGLLVSADGLVIPSNYNNGGLIAVDHFDFHTSLSGLLRTPLHIATVHVRRLHIDLPPKGHRSQMPEMGNHKAKISITLSKILCDDAVLLIESSKPNKPPLEFDIGTLALVDVGPNRPMQYHAVLVNPKPIGDIDASGNFGPWVAASPRDTPLDGAYSFTHANLDTIKGIGGMLSSTGSFRGTLDNITADGETDTPDFSLDTSDHPVPLHTRFHAIIDGTNGDVELQPVQAKLLNTEFTATGTVEHGKGIPGHDIELQVTMPHGHIEDLLKLGVKTEPAIMTGIVQMRAALSIPPGEESVSHRIALRGRLRIQSVRFTNPGWQKKVNEFSMRAQGQAEKANPEMAEKVTSDLRSQFQLQHGVMHFSQLEYQFPGARILLTGQYSLDGQIFDFHGKARLQAHVSQLTTGWKSVLLKPVDPFFSKNDAGTEVPIKVTGTKSDPKFGLDFGHKDNAAQH